LHLLSNPDLPPIETVKYALKKEVLYEGDAGKQGRPGTSAHLGGVTETGT
jgi:hypothetical protein